MESKISEIQISPLNYFFQKNSKVASERYYIWVYFPLKIFRKKIIFSKKSTVPKIETLCKMSKIRKNYLKWGMMVENKVLRTFITRGGAPRRPPRSKICPKIGTRNENTPCLWPKKSYFEIFQKIFWRSQKKLKMARFQPF